MPECLYFTSDGTPVPALTAEQMREIDRIAVREFGLGIPPQVYQRLELCFGPLFRHQYWIPLARSG
jgi:hypothetical protein